MLDPSMTNVLPKRVLASLLDLGIVAVLVAIVARLSAEQFTYSALDDDGAPLWTAEQFARLREIQQGGFNRKVVVSDTFYVWSGTRLWIPVALALAALAFVFIVLPAVTGRSPGHGFVGVQVRRLDGDEPTVRDHLLRAAGGVVDVLPVAIPGLLGWAIASMSPHRRRVGDRLAGTAVVDSTLPIRFTEPIRFEDPIRSADGAALGVDVDDSGRSDPPTDLRESSEPVVPQPENHRSSGPPATEPVRDDEQQTDTDAAFTIPERPDIFRTSTMGTPRQPRTERVDWEAPIAEPAPVWTPPPPEHRATTTQRVNITLEDLPVPDSPAAEAARPASAPPEPAIPDSIDAEPAAAPSATAALQWSDEWNSWLYFDSGADAWLRHDTAANRWVVLDD